MPKRRLRKSLKTTRQRKSKRREKTEPENSSAAAAITIQINLPSAKLAETVYTSVLPETRQTAGFRSRTIVRRKGQVLELVIYARDIVALRAASNSFLRFVAVALKAVNIVAPFYSAELAGVTPKATV